MIFVQAPGPGLVFVGSPSGTTYQANQNGIFVVASANSGDLSALIASGCKPLTPYGAYTLPPQTGWKPACTSNHFPWAMSGVASGKLMSCRVHFATTPLSGVIRLTFLNIIHPSNLGDYWDNAGPENMGPITVNGTVCYPGPDDIIGSYSATIITPGAMVDIFVNLSAAIPGGAKFYEGCFAQPTSGLQVPTFGAYYSPAPAQGPYAGNSPEANTLLGEGGVLSTSATDQTTNLSSIQGTPPAGSVGLYGASAICTVQPLTQPVVAVNGDSLEVGFKGGADAFNNVGPVSWACGDLVPAVNTAVSGGLVSIDAGAGYAGTGYASAMSARLRFYQHVNCTHFFNCLGTNDIVGGVSAATVEADLTTIGNLAASIGLTPIIATLPPNTTSTDGWVTTTNQTVGTHESNRTAVNTWARTTPAPHVGFVEFCTPCESTPGSGIWSAPGGTADGTHWGYNVELLVMQQADIAGLNVTLPAANLAYFDTYGRGARTVQAALDFLMNPADLGKEVHLGSAVINFNTTADQAIALAGPANYVVTKVVVRDGSLSSLNVAQGGIYSGASKSGALFGTSATTSFSDVTNTGGAHVFSGGTTVRGPTYVNEVIVSLTTAQGAAATATVDVYGVNLAA